MQQSGAREIEQVRAALLLARSFPRQIEIARGRLLEEAKRPAFADTALYRLPFGKRPVIGPSIRMAEAVLRLWGNLDLGVKFEQLTRDGNGQPVEIWVVTITDLETNTRVSEPMVVPMTAERASDKGTVVGTRRTASGQTRFIVALSESEVRRERGKARSIAQRNAIFKIVPRDIIEEMVTRVQETQRASDAKDPKAAQRRLLDILSGHFHVDLDQLSEVIGTPLDKLDPRDLASLRAIGERMRDTGATWRDLYREHVDAKKPKQEAAAETEKRADLDSIAPSADDLEDF